MLKSACRAVLCAVTACGGGCCLSVHPLVMFVLSMECLLVIEYHSQHSPSPSFCLLSPQVSAHPSSDQEHFFTPNHQITKSPNHQITKSPNHQITKSPNHQITKSPNHQITKSPNHQITKSPNHT
ncbi:hypothetical protein BZA77DRAFT_134143 [Pyronema omphalodes]|nr:hypothetical protein BZA77DRAFT_134143 [Pyronema omphalodes]